MSPACTALAVGANLADVPMTQFDQSAYESELSLAKDSLAKASTPEPFSKSKTSNGD